MKELSKIPFEALFWIASLILLFQLEPTAGNHMTLCPLQLAGFENCPGCGVGRSISLASHGDFRGSFDFHVLGIPALLIILNRIYQLVNKYIQLNYGKSNRTAT